MIEVQTGLFTVGVFQDVAWASKGLQALRAAGFVADSQTILAKATPEAAALIEKFLGAPADRFEVVTPFDSGELHERIGTQFERHAGK